MQSVQKQRYKFQLNKALLQLTGICTLTIYFNIHYAEMNGKNMIPNPLCARYTCGRMLAKAKLNI